ncbi:hypothetical protein [Desulfosporosinus sp. Sb-LF]|uniref:hypothetical protein n=1 Tax=Desulfosporosinus sp. Sb-LF TaxID=2560027 RepID=UPI00107F386C|nr:hypothetical protein [Desulfosporosinus sp. Sb-LF]TGE32465.1 hypothetical protein E4K68_12800 [Desulfosporosinus sp. Sb-LF]
METYFHNDPRIEEWVSQITEKIFTVCLLTGADSEAEFQRGCQIVKKVTTVLQGIPTFPSEYLKEALKQLLEQQLPDVRVINNIPEFRDVMDRMLNEGMLKAIDIQNKKIKETIIFPVGIVQENHQEGNQENDNVGLLGELSKDCEIDSVMSALAAVNITQRDVQKLEAEIVGLEPGYPKTKELPDTSQAPEQAEHLKYVLKTVFPNGTVHWNITLMEQTFLAQVEDILIFIHDPEHPCEILNFNKQGWKVLVCNSVDLTFPRRLEREIRYIQRLGKKSELV